MKLRRLGQAAIVLPGGYLTAPGDDLIAECKLDSTHAITIQ